MGSLPVMVGVLSEGLSPAERVPKNLSSNSGAGNDNIRMLSFLVLTYFAPRCGIVNISPTVSE